MKKKYIEIALLIIVSHFQWSCESETSEPEDIVLTTRVWGEDFIEQGIPAAEFVDGYAANFTKFLVVISDVTVASGDQPPVTNAPTEKVWDLALAGPFVVNTQTVALADFNSTSYVIAPSASSVSGNASVEDVQFMNDNGYSIYVQGTASNGVVSKSFSWGFNTDTLYRECESTGTWLSDTEMEIQLTIHGDHLFYDDAVSETPELRFNDIALADSDANGEVSAEELLNYDIESLTFYDVGNLPIYNLWDFIAHMTRTLGHIDGEGHCHTD